MAWAGSELVNGIKGIPMYWNAGYEATREAGSRLFNDNQYNANNPFSAGYGQKATTTVANEDTPTANDSAPTQRPSGNFTQDAADRAGRQNTLYSIDSGIAQANDALARLDRQASVGYGNIDREFQDASGRLLGQKKQAESQYNYNTTDQLNQYQSARNVNNQRANSFLEGGLRTLGANGAGGGSAARYALPYEANLQATGANSQAQSTNNRNMTALTMGWQQDQDEFTNAENDLLRQKEQGINDYRSQIEGQRADLTGTIGQLTGQKTIANGGDYQAALAASQPYTSRVSMLLNQIDGLAATPAIRERAVTIDRPDLAGYNWARPESAPVARQDPTLGMNPVLAALFGTPQEDQRQLV